MKKIVSIILSVVLMITFSVPTYGKTVSTEYAGADLDTPLEENLQANAAVGEKLNINAKAAMYHNALVDELKLEKKYQKIKEGPQHTYFEFEYEKVLIDVFLKFMPQVIFGEHYHLDKLKYKIIDFLFPM